MRAIPGKMRTDEVYAAAFDTITSMLYMRAIPGKMRTGEVYVAAFGSITFINIGVNASKTGCGR